MESILFEKVNKKVKGWCKGFADKNKDFMYHSQYVNIEEQLSSLDTKKTYVRLSNSKNIYEREMSIEKTKHDYIRLGSGAKMLSTWYCADFLEKYLYNKGDYSYSLKQSMLWGSIDPLLYSVGKKGNILPVWFVNVYLSACNLLILQKKDEARLLLQYSSPDKINFRIEPPESVCQFVSNMSSVFYNDRITEHQFPKPLNEIYSKFLQNLMCNSEDEMSNSINQVSEFHLSRTKQYQEFDTETKMLLPSEILAPLLFRKKNGLEVKDIEHPLIKDLFPVIERLIDVDTDPMFLKVMEYVL